MILKLFQLVNQSINQSKHTSLAPYVATESKAQCQKYRQHCMDGVETKLQSRILKLA